MLVTVAAETDAEAGWSGEEGRASGGRSALCGWGAALRRLDFVLKVGTPAGASSRGSVLGFTALDHHAGCSPVDDGDKERGAGEQGAGIAGSRHEAGGLKRMDRVGPCSQLADEHRPAEQEERSRLHCLPSRGG